MYEKTQALLDAAHKYGTERRAADVNALLDAAIAWWNAGSPMLSVEPGTPEAVAADPPIYTLEAWLKILTEQHAATTAELSEHRTATSGALARLTERIAALESDHRTLQANYKALAARVAAMDPVAPVVHPAPPPRFVPTGPGWYWVRGAHGDYPARWEPGYAPDLLRWLAPVAPYVEARTEEEARREPRRGDRWKSAHSPLHYTLIAPRNDGIPTFWSGIWSDRPASVSYGFDPGRPGETYLGNFAHELEAP